MVLAYQWIDGWWSITWDYTPGFMTFYYYLWDLSHRPGSDDKEGLSVCLSVMGKKNKIVYGENNTRLYYKLVAEVETRSIMRRSIGLLYYYYYYHYNPLTRSLVIIGRLYESREKQRKREWRQKIDKQNMNKFQGFSCYYFNVIIGLSRGERRRRGVKI